MLPFFHSKHWSAQQHHRLTLLECFPLLLAQALVPSHDIVERQQLLVFKTTVLVGSQLIGLPAVVDIQSLGERTHL
ncbi:hypothetical protein SDC9_165667 [bioreactor metagenome]|uniref:Uncharacterized protein n=1 Tax=bioreactor metagenome TaxID=1076179 RepID=A0A645FUW4_9ZZZZ